MDGVGASGGHHGLLILDEQHNSSGMPEAVQQVVETPSSLANDSQLHQLLSNMHNQLKNMEGGADMDDEDDEEESAEQQQRN